MPFEQAFHVVGTVISVGDGFVTFTPDEPLVVGDHVRVIPAHVDPTMALHEALWLVRGDEVIDRWPIDLRRW